MKYTKNVGNLDKIVIEVGLIVLSTSMYRVVICINLHGFSNFFQTLAITIQPQLF